LDTKRTKVTKDTKARFARGQLRRYYRRLAALRRQTGAWIVALADQGRFDLAERALAGFHPAQRRSVL